MPAAKAILACLHLWSTSRSFPYRKLLDECTGYATEYGGCGRTLCCPDNYSCTEGPQGMTCLPANNPGSTPAEIAAKTPAAASANPPANALAYPPASATAPSSPILNALCCQTLASLAVFSSNSNLAHTSQTLQCREVCASTMTLQTLLWQNCIGTMVLMGDALAGSAGVTGISSWLPESCFMMEGSINGSSFMCRCLDVSGDSHPDASCCSDTACYDSTAWHPSTPAALFVSLDASDTLTCPPLVRARLLAPCPPMTG